MDRASQVLARGLPPDVPRTYAALAEQGDVPLSTLHHRPRGQRSKEQKLQNQRKYDEKLNLITFPSRYLLSDYHWLGRLTTFWSSTLLLVC